MVRVNLGVGNSLPPTPSGLILNQLSRDKWRICMNNHPFSKAHLTGLRTPRPNLLTHGEQAARSSSVVPFPAKTVPFPFFLPSRSCREVWACGGSTSTTQWVRTFGCRRCPVPQEEVPQEEVAGWQVSLAYGGWPQD